MKMLLLFCIVIFLVSCAGRQNRNDIPPGEECAELYVLLPENYIIDLEGGSEVFLNPHIYEFIVFCTAEEAMRMRNRAQEKSLLPGAGNWKVYKLAGSPQDLARVCHETAYCLSSGAQVSDWMPENKLEAR